MKKYLLISVILLGIFYSCGFEEEDVVYPYTSVYLPNQSYNRNIIVGEGLELEIGVIFSGVVDNRQDRSVSYTIDPSLINTAGQYELPQTFYSFGDSEIRIPKGQLKGYLPVKLDSLTFLNDPKSLTGEYIIPIRLVSSSTIDSINAGMNYMKLSVSYFAKQHGNYTYSGKITATNAGVSTETTYANISTVTESYRLLKTTGPTRMRVVADATSQSKDPAKATYSFIVDVPVYGGGEISILPDPTSPVVVSPDGKSTYDVSTKTFRLNYQYAKGGSTYKVSEELVFRNRIRDVQSNGLYINEWRGF
ncbi:BT_3987 domain-containing protein [Dysgonomonas termitidis]|uniref:BT_3987 domain-containing protein n=1 Tax=Dysgonomonas termitidis TaxID=1516126 RepID=A0ABV9L4V0_9BACT